MKAAKTQSGDYKVGYRRPPKHSQFQPGRSGNPKGRPKPRDNLLTMLQRILTEKISLREGNQIRRVSKAEALVRSMIVGAMKGDPKAINALFKVMLDTDRAEA